MGVFKLNMFRYYDFEDVDNLINSLCTKGVKEN